jgi:hypothetical protein
MVFVWSPWFRSCFPGRIRNRKRRRRRTIENFAGFPSLETSSDVKVVFHHDRAARHCPMSNIRAKRLFEIRGKCVVAATVVVVVVCSRCRSKQNVQQIEIGHRVAQNFVFTFGKISTHWRTSVPHFRI